MFGITDAIKTTITSCPFELFSLPPLFYTFKKEIKKLRKEIRKKKCKETEVKCRSVSDVKREGLPPKKNHGHSSFKMNIQTSSIMCREASQNLLNKKREKSSQKKKKKNWNESQSKKTLKWFQT